MQVKNERLKVEEEIIYLIPPVRSMEETAINGVVRVPIPLAWKQVDGVGEKK